jgi:DNA invertase Pin-like site-specific DNA recombinase
MKYGYGRVSTVAQDTALQEDAFKRAGVERIILEKWSSVGARPGLMALLAGLQRGDVVTVYKLDRMGRSLQDLLGILERIHSVGAAFQSLTEPIDTNTPAGKLMYSILGAVAEFEKTLIRERSLAGQVAAVERGVKIGRPRSLTTKQEEEVLERWRAGASMKSLARVYQVHMTAIRRVVYAATRPDHPWLRPNRPVLGPRLVRQ